MVDLLESIKTLSGKVKVVYQLWSECYLHVPTLHLLNCTQQNWEFSTHQAKIMFGSQEVGLGYYMTLISSTQSLASLHRRVLCILTQMQHFKIYDV